MLSPPASTPSSASHRREASLAGRRPANGSPRPAPRKSAPASLCKPRKPNLGQQLGLAASLHMNAHDASLPLRTDSVVAGVPPRALWAFGRAEQPKRYQHRRSSTVATVPIIAVQLASSMERETSVEQVLFGSQTVIEEEFDDTALGLDATVPTRSCVFSPKQNRGSSTLSIAQDPSWSTSVKNIDAALRASIPNFFEPPTPEKPLSRRKSLFRRGLAKREPEDSPGDLQQGSKWRKPWVRTHFRNVTLDFSELASLTDAAAT